MGIYKPKTSNKEFEARLAHCGLGIEANSNLPLQKGGIRND